MNPILQRLKSKTYWTAITMALLTVAELNGAFITQWVPAEYRVYLLMLWPVVMITLREITTTALSSK